MIKGKIPLLTAFAILVVMLVLEYGFGIIPAFPVNLIIYLAAYLLAGYNVLDLAFRKARRLDIFNEFFLMSVATIGAFSIGSYSEGVAVMVFYSIGEWFQDAAVDRAKRSIKALLDVRPDQATVWREGRLVHVPPANVQIGEVVQLKAGEKLALDGRLKSEYASFDTAALTGESVPQMIGRGGQVLAGMINRENVVEVEVSALFRDSKLSRILEMVQDATARKSQTQLFISRFAKVYTPVVFALAVLVCFVPYLVVGDYSFREWFYRALVFLVISCPCALVVSIPLGYFGGIGLASRNGILFKGSNFLDVMTKVDTVVMDKTGTLTKGVFKVQEVVSVDPPADELVSLTASVEANSTHPVARAIVTYASEKGIWNPAEEVREIPGHGLAGRAGGKQVLVGNTKLLSSFEVSYPREIEALSNTTVVVAIEGSYAGYITVADEAKPDAGLAVKELRNMGIETIMLSGDRQSVVDQVALALGIDHAYGNLLPEDKVRHVTELKAEGRRLAFAGDGVNDAPVVALADAGIAMGGLGSDATVETADIVIQNDQPSKIAMAIRIGKLTRQVVWQNITMALVVKVAVLALGAGGVASLWEAVIADVGVALLAILNAVRIQRSDLS
ncbi:heavy metal translocating P-type ATPase [Pedobacter deserti]|uniref:heavy metal translocating P-type ATPase n=1 Tax=Pedobacter deserti TaxID=2817382 RepID=UPI002109B08B|nr:heavy metal translocating P-type ATPase [Pedobacter sp. SYSU D00382]